MSPRGQEKRRHQRVSGRITLRTASTAGLGTIEMETANLSLGGATCLSDQAIPPMTRLQLSIFLPSTDGRLAKLHYPIEVDAVVVRTERLNGTGGEGDPPPGQAPKPNTVQYRLAVFFSHMAEKDRDLLSRYLSSVEPS